MEQNQISEIKRLATALDENAIFSYSKRALLFVLEFIGWLLFISLLLASAYLLKYHPSVDIPINSQDYVKVEAHIKEVNQIFNALALLLFIFEVPVIFLTLFIRRFRKKKAALYELINMIKTL